jgi:hypothetical protein
MEASKPSHKHIRCPLKCCTPDKPPGKINHEALAEIACLGIFTWMEMKSLYQAPRKQHCSLVSGRAAPSPHFTQYKQQPWSSVYICHFMCWIAGHLGISSEDAISY